MLASDSEVAAARDHFRKLQPVELEEPAGQKAAADFVRKVPLARGPARLEADVRRSELGRSDEQTEPKGRRSAKLMTEASEMTAIVSEALV